MGAMYARPLNAAWMHRSYIDQSYHGIGRQGRDRTSFLLVKLWREEYLIVLGSVI